MSDNNNNYKIRHLARIVLEAQSPIALGTGEKDIITDALVATDANGLPYIPGSSIAGVLRHHFNGTQWEDWFGKEAAEKNDEKAHGSYLIFSEARMVGKDGRVVDGLQVVDFDDPFYANYAALPIRQHVRINHRGTAEDNGKFDEQVVFKGTRFCFTVEMVAKENLEDTFSIILDSILSSTFRIGGGTRSGFGSVKVVECRYQTFDLSKKGELEAYLEYDSSLNEKINGSKELECQPSTADGIYYTLNLKPTDFFQFGSGLSDDEVDMTPVREKTVVWDDNGLPSFCDQQVLIPASSVKGALAHRVAYHYNWLARVFADKESDLSSHVGKNNLAVFALFGSEGEGGKEKTGQRRGCVCLSDIFLDGKKAKDKIFNHVSIDRFTGGAIDSALFAEKAVYGKDLAFEMTIFVDDKAMSDNIEKSSHKDINKEQTKNQVLEALKLSLQDLCSGLLPLGGGVNRGHGCFEGTITIEERRTK